MFCIFLFLTHMASASVDDLGKKIVDLRSDLEEAGQSLEDNRKKYTSSLDVLLQRKADLEMQLKKERLKSIQLEEKKKFLSVSIQKEEKPKELYYWAESLEKQIKKFPFRQEERLARWKDWNTRYQEGRESISSLTADLWDMTESELKLSASNEYRLAKIKVKGLPEEAEVARVGNIQVLFRTVKGDIGYLGENGEGLLVSGSEAKAVDRLLDKFKDKNYSGWFELPGLKGERQL